MPLMIPAALFLLTLACGVWLSRAGKPLNTVIFTVHKLLALGTVIVTAVPIYKILQGTALQLIVIAPVIVAAVCVIALFLTGALMSLEKPAYTVLLAAHRVAPWVAVIALAGMIDLLSLGAIAWVTR